MVPELLNCSECGHASLVLSWSPIYDDAVELWKLDDSKTLLVSCKIDCAQCGPRIQNVRPLSSNDDRYVTSRN